MVIGNHPVNYDYMKLHLRIIEKCGSLKEFAKQIGLSQNAVTDRMKGRVTWRMQDIEASLSVLDIGRDEIGAYYFTPKSDDK